MPPPLGRGKILIESGWTEFWSVVVLSIVLFTAYVHHLNGSPTVWSISMFLQGSIVYFALWNINTLWDSNLEVKIFDYLLREYMYANMVTWLIDCWWCNAVHKYFYNSKYFKFCNFVKLWVTWVSFLTYSADCWEVEMKRTTIMLWPDVSAKWSSMPMVLLPPAAVGWRVSKVNGHTPVWWGQISLFISPAFRGSYLCFPKKTTSRPYNMALF